MSRQLTEGAIATIMRGGVIENPVIQLLGSSRIAGAADERYQLIVSDGSHLNTLVMISPRLNNMLTCGELSNYSVVRVNHLVTNLLNLRGSRKICVTVILDLTVLAKGTEVGVEIGNPVAFTLHDSDPRPAAPVAAAPPSKTVPREVALRAARLRAVVPRAAVLYRMLEYAIGLPEAQMRKHIKMAAKDPPEPLRTDLMCTLVMPLAAMRAEVKRLAECLEPAWRKVARRSATRGEAMRRAVKLQGETLNSAMLYGRLRTAATFPTAKLREALLKTAEQLPSTPIRTELLRAAALPPEVMRVAVRRALALLAPAWRVMIPRGVVSSPKQVRLLAEQARKQRTAEMRLMFRTVATFHPAEMRDQLLRAAAQMPWLSRVFLRVARLPPEAMYEEVRREALIRAPARWVLIRAPALWALARRVPPPA